ncbi:hypothetical protein ACFL13_00015 [Patescibacteria group bacterium]
MSKIHLFDIDRTLVFNKNTDLFSTRISNETGVSILTIRNFISNQYQLCKTGEWGVGSLGRA